MTALSSCSGCSRGKDPRCHEVEYSRVEQDSQKQEGEIKGHRIDAESVHDSPQEQRPGKGERHQIDTRNSQCDFGKWSHESLLYSTWSFRLYPGNRSKNSMIT